MSKIMTVLGIVLAAIGLALALVGLISPARLGAMFLSLDSAATLIVGGILSAGLGAVIAALENAGSGVARAALPEATNEATPAMRTRMQEFEKIGKEQRAANEDDSSLLNLPDFRGGHKDAAAAAAAVAATAATAFANKPVPEVPVALPTPPQNPSVTVAETIDALERAKSDMRAAFSGGMKQPAPAVPSVAIPPPPDEPEDEEVIEEAAEEVQDPNELYVVEEKNIRGRPSRILSDGTVEAETDEGWMRFENLEHLNEYLDG